MNGTGPTILKAYIDDTERISYSDSSDITSPGKAGAGTYDGYSGTYFRIQDVVADDIVTGYSMSAEPGSYSMTGQGAGLKAARKMAADAGSYTFTGQAAALRAARKIAADAGSYLLTGQDVSFVYSKLGKNVRIVGINVIDGKLVYLTGKLYET
jgi:hypothetical protein